MQLKQIVYYPVKSMSGITLTETDITPSGLKHDREWMIGTPAGHSLNAGQYPQLRRWQAFPDDHGLTLFAPDDDTIRIEITEMTHAVETSVLQDTFTAYYAHSDANALLSEKLGVNCRIYWIGAFSNRLLSGTQTPLSFAHQAPCLLINTASLRTPPETENTESFRPNLLINSGNAGEENTWQRIRIGAVDFKCLPVEPFEHPATPVSLEKQASYRCGIRLLALNNGTLSLNDSISVLA